MIQRVLAVMAGVVICSLAYAGDERVGRDDFVSTTIADVFDKVGKYTSGEKTFFEPDKNAERAESANSADPLGRQMPDPAIKPLRRPSASE